MLILTLSRLNNTLDYEEEYSSGQEDWLNTMQSIEQTHSNGSNQSKVSDNTNIFIEGKPTKISF